MSTKTTYPRDLLVYFAFCALPIAGFWLLGESGVQFDTALFTVSLIGLFGFKIYYHDKAMLLDWDENLSTEGFLYILLGVMGSLFIATFLTTSFVHSATLISSISVPVTKLGLTVGLTVLPKFWSDILFTLTLTVTAEETSKLVTSLGLYVWLKDLVGSGIAKYVAIVAPIGGWAMLHAFQAYTGPYTLVYVATAFLAGLLMYYAMSKTKSLLAALLIHAGYNIIILYLMGG